jgi:Domain of unknown function (DUF4190)
MTGEAPFGESVDPGTAGARPQTSGMAIASLVLGIVGLVVFPIVASIAAIIVGHSARRAMRSDPNLTGDGYATAGIVLGWIALALAVLGIVLILLAW